MWGGGGVRACKYASEMIAVFLAIQQFLIETDLFPKETLVFYTRHNLNLTDEKGADADLYTKFYNSTRGGGQGTMSAY